MIGHGERRDSGATHVRDELGDAVDLILDGGPCAVGIESTVLDLSRRSDVPKVTARLESVKVNL